MSQKYQFVAAHASEYPVTLLCRVLGLARSGYYAWHHQAQSAHARRDHELSDQIQTIFTNSRESYGSPRGMPNSKPKGCVVAANVWQG